MIALIGHIVTLSALVYLSADNSTVGGQAAIISVEIISAPPVRAAVDSRVPDASGEREPVEPVDLIRASESLEQRSEPDAPPLAFAVPGAAIVPNPAPRRSSPPPRHLKRPVTTLHRQGAPLEIVPTSDPSDGLDPSGGGSIAPRDADMMLSDVSSVWKNRLMNHLDRHKRYPSAARARGAQGTALLSFGMDRDGRVLGFQLVSSSGYPELDDEVLAMIQRASPLPPAPPEIRTQVVKLVVPVRFRM